MYRHISQTTGDYLGYLYSLIAAGYYYKTYISIPLKSLRPTPTSGGWPFVFKNGDNGDLSVRYCPGEIVYGDD